MIKKTGDMAKKEKKTVTAGQPASPLPPTDPEVPLATEEDLDQLPQEEDIETPPYEKASPGEGP